MLGEVRIGSIGLRASQGELVPWANDAVVTVTATNLITEATHSATATVVASGVATTQLPIGVTTDPGPVELSWESGGETITTHLEVRAARLPVLEMPSTNPSGRINDTSRPAWKVERALSDALLEFERECKVPMTPRRVEVVPTISGSRITWGIPRVHRIVSCDDPDVDLSEITIGPAFAEGSVPSGTTFVVEHGETTLAPDVKRAILLMASSRIADGPADPRGFLLHDGGATRLRRPGAVFDIDEAEVARKRHMRVLVR